MKNIHRIKNQTGVGIIETMIGATLLSIGIAGATTATIEIVQALDSAESSSQLSNTARNLSQIYFATGKKLDDLTGTEKNLIYNTTRFTTSGTGDNIDILDNSAINNPKAPTIISSYRALEFTKNGDWEGFEQNPISETGFARFSVFPSSDYYAIEDIPLADQKNIIPNKKNMKSNRNGIKNVSDGWLNTLDDKKLLKTLLKQWKLTSEQYPDGWIYMKGKRSYKPYVKRPLMQFKQKRYGAFYLTYTHPKSVEAYAEFMFQFKYRPDIKNDIYIQNYSNFKINRIIDGNTTKQFERSDRNETKIRNGEQVQYDYRGSEFYNDNWKNNGWYAQQTLIKNIQTDLTVQGKADVGFQFEWTYANTNWNYGMLVDPNSFKLIPTKRYVLTSAILKPNPDSFK